MKNALFIFLICLVSCKQDTTVIDGNVALKNIPKQVFTPHHTSNISFNDCIISFKNPFKRLPNSEFSKFYLKKHTDKYIPYFNLTINVSADNKITFEGSPNDKKHLLKDIREFADFASQGKTTLLHLNFDQNLSFNDFYHFIQFIKPIEDSGKIKINNELYIYDLKKLPDCDCSL